MLVVISPAKRLDWSATGCAGTTPEFAGDAAILAGHARQLGVKGLKSLMSISDDLARLNRDRFRDFATDPAPETLRPAVHAFAGDTYIGLDARSLSEDDLAWAQERLRILSGLYGVLRPLDEIQAYRLEMGSRMKTRRGKTLYDFWGDRIARSLRRTAEALGTDTLVNCASNEYFSAVDLARLGLRVVTPTFLEEHDGEARIVSFFAKRARGSMARFIIAQRVTSPEGLTDFDWGGYRHDAERSGADTPVFVRAAPEG